jgi:hypothetical protein
LRNTFKEDEGKSFRHKANWTSQVNH